MVGYRHYTRPLTPYMSSYCSRDKDGMKYRGKKQSKVKKLTASDIKELEKICWKELGTKDDYEKFISKSNMICGDSVGAFIRAQIGVDRHLAMERFSQFLSDTTLNSLQEEYIKSIISYVCDNGDITTSTLMEEEPFAQYEWIDAIPKTPNGKIQRNLLQK